MESKPISCLNCGEIIPIEKRKNKFCNRSCSASYNNRKRESRSIESRRKTSISVRKTLGIIPITINDDCCTLYINKCAKTGQLFCSSTWKKYHPDITTSKELYYYNCKFNFSLSQFPDWFDLSLITKYDMYSTPGSRKGIKNINGVSRDHLLSVSYGWKNNIDPKLISHPANCELKRHKHNQSKGHKCQITIDELHERIIKFNNQYPNWCVVKCDKTTHPL